MGGFGDGGREDERREKTDGVGSGLERGLCPNVVLKFGHHNIEVT